MSYTLVHDANEVVVGPKGEESSSADGPGRNEDTDGGLLATETDAAVVIEDGTVHAVGDSGTLRREYPAENAAVAVDADGRCVLPGFVDAHTHALFAGDRSDEFAAKLQGVPYQEILAEGGGILRTVRAVREASEDHLVERFTEALDLACRHGTTTFEVKSGYGLSVESELKMLAAIERAAADHPVDVVPTFMGAHAVPEGRDADAYTEDVIDEQLPAVESQGVAAFCDVFCEEDVFSVEQSRVVLEAGREHGLTPKVHAEEFVRFGGAQLGAELSAASADHLLYATEEDAGALLDGDVTPVMLPGTAFGLGEAYADPEPFLDRNVVPAIATDFNPNCYAPSLGFAATLACVGMGMTPAEAVLGITQRGAAALNRTNGAGTLREGAPGDLVVLGEPSYTHLTYNFGVNLAETVMKNGAVVSET